MATRVNYATTGSKAYRAMSQLEHVVKNCGLELSLLIVLYMSIRFYGPYGEMFKFQS